MRNANSARIEPRTQGQISWIEARKRAMVNMAASIDENLRRAPISDFGPPCNSPLSLGRPRCKIAPANREGARADNVRKESISRASQAGGRRVRVRQSRHYRAAADGCLRNRDRDPL